MLESDPYDLVEHSMTFNNIVVDINVQEKLRQHMLSPCSQLPNATSTTAGLERILAKLTFLFKYLNQLVGKQDKITCEEM